MAVVQTNGGDYSADCLRQIHDECKIPYSQINNLRAFVRIALKHPETLEFNVSDDDCHLIFHKEVKEAQTEIVQQNERLDDFQLIPNDSNGNPKLSGMALFEHMCKFCNVQAGKGTKDGQLVRIMPLKHLNVEVSSDAMDCIQPLESELCWVAIMRDSFGEKAKRKCAQRKLNNLGLIIGQTTVVNSEQNMAKMREQLQFANALVSSSHRH